MDDALDTPMAPDEQIAPDDATLAESAARLHAMTDQPTIARLCGGYSTALQEHVATRGTDPFDANTFIGRLHATVPHDVDPAVVKVFDAHLARLLSLLPPKPVEQTPAPAVTGD